MARHLKAALFDLAAGILAAVVVLAACFIVQERFSNALEYVGLGLPVFLFPAVAWLRARRSSISPIATFVLVSIPLFVMYWLYSVAANTRISKLSVPLCITAVASLLCVIASHHMKVLHLWWRGSTLALLVLVPVGAALYLVPDTVGRMLTYAVSEKAPDVSFHLLDGQTASVGAQKGRVVVLNFWGVRCGPCIRELPELNATARLLQNRKDVQFIAVDSSIGNETKTQVGDFARKLGLTVPIAYESDRSAYNAFSIGGLPTTVVIDPQGAVRYRRIGYAASAGYGRWLTRTIDQLSNAQPQ